MVVEKRRDVQFVLVVRWWLTFRHNATKFLVWAFSSDGYMGLVESEILEGFDDFDPLSKARILTLGPLGVDIFDLLPVGILGWLNIDFLLPCCFSDKF